MAVNRGAVVVDLMDDDDGQESLYPQFPTTTKTTTRLLTHVSPEGVRFLEDLTNYLPIGTLHLHTAACDDPPHWEETIDIANLSESGLSLQHALSLEKLVARRLVRICVNGSKSALRIYVLPSDVGKRYLRHDGLNPHLFSLLQDLDVSFDAWHGRPTAPTPFDMYAAGAEGSLYYLFNNIPSPNPTLENVSSHFHREAMANLLNHNQLPGQKTVLYAYQRKSACLMLQRECEDKLELDPRLEPRTALDGTSYYYAPWEVSFFRSPRFYESCKGGILAETMGLGKTVICLALILATRGYLPQIPAQYDQVTTRLKVASLVETAISAINRHSAPWRSFFDRHEYYTGEYMGHCIDLMRKNAPSYEVPVQPIRWDRGATISAPRKMTLAATTLVVVPRNLLSQWKVEIQKHTTEGALNVLVMDDNKVALPLAEELTAFDLILFSRPRFEHEDRDGSDSSGRRLSRYPTSCTCPYIGATRTRDCVCIRPDDLYESPLRTLHFLRVIIDEGHGMAAENTRIASLASNLLVASHRWVVSGTPAKDLMGVEMDLVGPVSQSGTPVPSGADDANSQCGSGISSATSDTEFLRRDALLNQRKSFNAKDEKIGAVRSIGSLASTFLKIKPWSPGDEKAADWADHFFRHEMLRPRMRTFSAFSQCLRRTLESLVIRTQPVDVERDIELPPLTHEIVRLDPSFYDKLTVNAFVFVLTANAITSERTDVDYIFHKNSGKERAQLLTNLRASAFYWTGFSAADIEAAIQQGQEYLLKQSKQCSSDDEDLLKRCVDQARTMVASQGWRSLTQSHEIGLFVKDWPAESASFWSFDHDKVADSLNSSLLCGASQLIQAQDLVNRQTSAPDPAEGLSGAGIRALSITLPPPMVEKKAPVLVKAGIPSSSLGLNQMDAGRPTKTASRKIRKDAAPSGSMGTASSQEEAASVARDEPQEPQLPQSSPLCQSAIVGTNSAKLSYLLSRIEDFHRDEKILVFYDHENTAYYIAQALEVLHIDYLIYARTLTPASKSEYIVRFNQKAEHRVMLMDIGQAAFGLNLSAASRVFFINPVNRPHIEAQALKRAHRIGQTRAVYAETLILRGTIEEKVFERARCMSRAEHKKAKELDDDEAIRNIIQSAQPMTVTDDEAKGIGRVALMHKGQRLFGRAGWAKWKKAAMENGKLRNDKKRPAQELEMEGKNSKKRSKKKR